MEQKGKTIEIDGVHHEIEGFDDNQKYLLTQIEDLTKKASSIKFQLDQVQVAKDVFAQSLIETLQEPSDA